MNNLPCGNQLDLGDIDAYLPDGGCITVVAGLQLDALVAAFGASPLTAQPDSADVPDAYLYSTGLGGLVVVEVEGGFQGMRTEVISEASRGGRVGSIQWTIDLDSTLTLAETGRILFSDDVLAAEPGTALPEAVAPYLSDSSLGDDWLAGALQAIASFTGAVNVTEPEFELIGRLRIDPIAVDGSTSEPAPQSRPEPDGELTLEKVADYAGEWLVAFVCMGEGRVIDMVQAALRAPGSCRRLAAFCARSALTEVDAQEHPAAADKLSSLDAGSTPGRPGPCRSGRCISQPGLDRFLGPRRDAVLRRGHVDAERRLDRGV